MPFPGLLLAAALAAAPSPASREDPAAAEIRGILEAAVRADLAGDAAFYERLLTPGFTLGTSRGELLGKEEKLAGFRSGAHVVESEAVSDVRVRLYGGVTAIVTFKATVAWRDGSERGRRTVLFTQTYVRDGGGWKLAASHGSEVAGSAPENP